MLTTMTGTSANDATRSEAPKAQPFTYVQGTSHRVNLKVLNEDGSPKDLTALTPRLATTLLDGTATQLAFTVDTAADGTAHLSILPGTVLVPGSYSFEVYLDDDADVHDQVVATSVLTVKASKIPTT